MIETIKKDKEMDILEIAEEAYYERAAELREMEEEAEAQREQDAYREERDCGICDIAEDIVDYFKN